MQFFLIFFLNFFLIYSFKTNLYNFKYKTKLFTNNFKKDGNEVLNNEDNKFFRFGAFPRLDEPNEYGELTWYPIGLPNEFSRSKPNKITIRDINYIVWKDSCGYYALIDVCSHQGSSFQGGCSISNTISCPYHGYTFNGTYGELLDIPEVNINKNLRHYVNAYKVIEKNGIVFLNTVPIDLNNPNNINESLIWTEPEATNYKQKAVILTENFEHYAKFVSVNSLDICHIGFVHTFGNRKNPNPVYNSKIEKIDDSKFHYKISYEYLAGKNSLVNKIYNFNKITVENEYILPHTTVARVLFGNFSSTIITIATPISKFKTRLFVKAYRNYWFNSINDSSIFTQPFDYLINNFGDYLTYKTMFLTLKQDKSIVDNIDKLDYKSMHGKFSIKYDMMSNHYKNLYKKFYEYDQFNF